MLSPLTAQVGPSIQNRYVFDETYACPVFVQCLQFAISKHTPGALWLHIYFAQELVYNVHELDSTILCVAVLRTKAVPHVARSVVESSLKPFFQPVGSLDF